MPISKARQKANRKWNESNLERIYVTVKKGQKKIIQDIATQNGQTLNAYVIDAVKMRLKTENNIDL